MMDLLDEMSIENTILLKEKDGQFYCYQIATESNVNSVQLNVRVKSELKRSTCQNTEYSQCERRKEKKDKKEYRNCCSRMP